MEKSLYSNPAIIFSENTAKRIFNKPKKNIQTEIKRQKIKEAKEGLKQSGFYDN